MVARINAIIDAPKTILAHTLLQHTLTLLARLRIKRRLLGGAQAPDIHLRAAQLAHISKKFNRHHLCVNCTGGIRMAHIIPRTCPCLSTAMADTICGGDENLSAIHNDACVNRSLLRIHITGGTHSLHEIAEIG